MSVRDVPLGDVPLGDVPMGDVSVPLAALVDPSSVVFDSEAVEVAEVPPVEPSSLAPPTPEPSSAPHPKSTAVNESSAT
jgi:hypothetical protein